MKFGDQRLPERFWSKIYADADGCWRWIGQTITSSGRKRCRACDRAIESERVRDRRSL